MPIQLILNPRTKKHNMASPLYLSFSPKNVKKKKKIHWNGRLYNTIQKFGVNMILFLFKKCTFIQKGCNKTVKISTKEFLKKY